MRRGRLWWEGYAEKEGIKRGMKGRAGGWIMKSKFIVTERKKTEKVKE